MDDLKLLRDHYKREYKKALTEKVNKQRKELKEREAQKELRQKLKLEEVHHGRCLMYTCPVISYFNELRYYI